MTFWTGRLTAWPPGGVAGGADRDAADRGELGEAVELRDRAVDADEIARIDGDTEAVVEDEDALGGERIGVGIGGLLLEVEAAELAGRLVVADDDAFDGDGGARARAVGPVPWTSWMRSPGRRRRGRRRSGR